MSRLERCCVGETRQQKPARIAPVVVVNLICVEDRTNHHEPIVVKRGRVVDAEHFATLGEGTAAIQQPTQPVEVVHG